MTDTEFANIGKSCREALDGNLLVGSFAAELVGESYPFSKTQRDIVFDGFENIALGKRFAQWVESQP